MYNPIVIVWIFKIASMRPRPMGLGNGDGNSLFDATNHALQ